jgi:hypothetical protein
MIDLSEVEILQAEDLRFRAATYPEMRLRPLLTEIIYD